MLEGDFGAPATPADEEGGLREGWVVTAEFGVPGVLPNSVVEVLGIGRPCLPGVERLPAPASVEAGDDTSVEPQPAAMTRSTPSVPLINHRDLRVTRRAG